MKERYVISLDRPTGMTRKEMKDYLIDAATGWKGGYEGDHPLVGHDMQVHVVAIPKETPPLQSIAEPTPWGAVAVAHLPKGKP